MPHLGGGGGWATFRVAFEGGEVGAEGFPDLEGGVEVGGEVFVGGGEDGGAVGGVDEFGELVGENAGGDAVEGGSEFVGDEEVGVGGEELGDAVAELLAFGEERGGRRQRCASERPARARWARV